MYIFTFHVSICIGFLICFTNMFLPFFSASFAGICSTFFERNGADLNLSPNAMMKLHNIPYVNLDITGVGPFPDDFVEVLWCFLVLAFLLKAFGEPGEVAHHPRQNQETRLHSSNINILTLILSPTIFWPSPGDFRLVTHPELLDADARQALELAIPQLFLAWERLDRILSSPIYSGVQRLWVQLEGDYQGYYNAREVSREKPELILKKTLWECLPRTMEMRKLRNDQKSFACIVENDTWIYPLN